MGCSAATFVAVAFTATIAIPPASAQAADAQAPIDSFAFAPQRLPIGLYANAQIEDDGPNMETHHEGTYRCPRVGHADCQPDLRSARRAGFHANRVRFPD
jgi:hypothetical protein